MTSCARLQRSLSQAGFNLCRPTAHFYSSSGAANDIKPASSREKSSREKSSNKTPTKSPKTLRGSRLERVPDDLGFDQWSWSEVNLADKTIATAAGDLPISPLVDSTWVEARQRKKGKARPEKNNHNRFQRQLRQNAFAQLLATPVRLCNITRTQLPNSMLQSFALVRHPETKKVWWIPEGLQAPREPANGKSDEAQEADEPSSAATEGGAGHEVTTMNAAGDSEGAALQPARYRYPTKVLARQDLIENFSTAGRKYHGAHKRLGATSSVPGLAKNAHWRPDMYAVILDQRRRQIMEDLLHLSTMCEEMARKYIIRVAEAKYAATYVHRAAFLWLGEEKPTVPEEGKVEAAGEADDAKAEETRPDEVKRQGARAEIDPEQYATLDIDGDPTTTRPVYNLPKLLGQANVARLRSESSVFKDGSLFLLRSQRSGPVNKKLWSLQGYVAEYSKL